MACGHKSQVANHKSQIDNGKVYRPQGKDLQEVQRASARRQQGSSKEELCARHAWQGKEAQAVRICYAAPREAESEVHLRCAGASICEHLRQGVPQEGR